MIQCHSNRTIMCKRIAFTLLLLVSMIIVFAQSGEKRIALVIGNSAYLGGQALRNPVNDANLMARTLKSLGFYVIKCVNASELQMEDAIESFSRKLPNYNVALFYYAGHGMQVDGTNYLIPIDAKLENKIAVRHEAVSVKDIVAEFEYYQNNTNIIILDACRDNPFRSWSRGGARGFIAMKPASGTIIAFATSEGSTAADGKGSNGLFTTHLVNQLVVPQSIESVFKRTRVAVQNESQGKQSPQEWTKLTGDFYFMEPTGEPTTYISNNTQIRIIEETLPPGTIKLTSKLTGSLYIDGQEKGSLSNGHIYTLKNLIPGIHYLKINNWEQTVYVKSSQIHNVTASNKTKDTPDYLNDSRDNKSYKIVKIGKQVWMAENLAYKTSNGSWTYNNSQSNISKYGYLYNWETAKNVCPVGWHLPTKTDYKKLLNNYDDEGNSSFIALIQGGNSGFSASFGGWRSSIGGYGIIGKYAFFWSSSPGETDAKAWYLDIYSTLKRTKICSHNKLSGFSVRCLQDSAK